MKVMTDRVNGVWMLQIHDIRHNDEGDYECQVI